MKKFTPHITGLVVFAIYILTLAPSVVQIDAGELTTVQLTLGIAHPTGYPLFTMIGYLFSKIPLGLRPIYQMNLLAAFWCAAAITLFSLTAKLILDNMHRFIKPVLVSSKKAHKKKKIEAKIGKAEETQVDAPHESVTYFAICLGGLILAFSKTFWFQSTSVEVYSLECFFMLFIIWSTLFAYFHSLDNAEKGFRYWFILAIALALGFSTHMTTLFTLPAIAFLYFSVYGFNKKAFIQAGYLILVFAPILVALYAYLPIRAAQKPMLNWGNPVDMERILRHVAGNQYSVWMFSSFASAKKQLTYFVENFPSEFNVSVVFIVTGLVYLFMRAKKIMIFFLTLALFTLLYSINYDINDIDSYFLLTYISLGFFGVFGVAQIFKLLYDKKFQYGLALVATLIFIGIQMYFTIDKVDQHDDFVFEDYTKSALAFADKDAVIFSYQWDYLVSPAYYFQKIEHFRPDVKIIDKELLRRSWYYNQMETTIPHITAKIKPDIAMFLTGLQKFERKEKFDAQFLEEHYRSIMTNLVATNASNKTFYIGSELFEGEMQRKEFSLPDGYSLVPDLFFFRVIEGKGYTPAPNPDFTIRFPKYETHYSETIRQLVSSMLVRRALYEMEFDHVERAKVYIKKIKQDFPEYRLPQGLAEVITN